MKITPEILNAYKKRERLNKVKQVRTYLFKKDPRCHYCRIVTKPYLELANRNLKKGERYPEDMTTLEHLYDRYDSRRYTKTENHKVIACYKCNTARADQRNKSFSEDFHKKRIEIMLKRKADGKKISRPLLLEYDE